MSEKDKEGEQEQTPESNDLGAFVGYRTPIAEEESPSEEELEEEVEEEEEEVEEEELEEEEEEPEVGFEPFEGFNQLPKPMQAQVTKLAQETAQAKLRLSVLDSIEKDPQTALLTLAEKYGIDLGQGGQDEEVEEFAINEVLQPEEGEDPAKYIARAMATYLGQFAKHQAKATMQKPAASTTQDFSIEKAVQGVVDGLSEKHKDWALYQDRMIELITKHPTLAGDPDELYKLAKGSAVNATDAEKARRTDMQVKKLKSGERPRGPRTVSKKGKILTFSESFDQAYDDVMNKRG